jgi:hypothetical protein
MSSHYYALWTTCSGAYAKRVKEIDGVKAWLALTMNANPKYKATISI